MDRLIPGNGLAKMVFGDEIDGKVILEDMDIPVGCNCVQQGPFDLATAPVLCMNDPVPRVPSFPPQVEATSCASELDASVDQFFQPHGALFHKRLDRIAVAQTHPGALAV